MAGQSSTEVRRANLSLFAEAFAIWRVLCTGLDPDGVFLWANIAPEVTDLMNQTLAQAMVLHRMCRVLTGSTLHMLRSGDRGRLVGLWGSA